MVWINMLAGDTIEAAERLACTFAADPRLHHFYDESRWAGQCLALSLGGEPGDVAWDSYLFYAGGAAWERMPPQPIEWMHQLWGSSWADSARYRCGDELEAALLAALRRLAHP